MNVIHFESTECQFVENFRNGNRETSDDILPIYEQLYIRKCFNNENEFHNFNCTLLLKKKINLNIKLVIFTRSCYMITKISLSCNVNVPLIITYKIIFLTAD